MHVFIGYDASSKDYKLYNPSNEKIVVYKHRSRIWLKHHLPKGVQVKDQEKWEVFKIYRWNWTYINDLLCLFVDNESLTFEENMKDKRWRQAMENEINVIKKNDTWVIKTS